MTTRVIRTALKRILQDTTISAEEKSELFNDLLDIENEQLSTLVFDNRIVALDRSCNTWTEFDYSCFLDMVCKYINN